MAVDNMWPLQFDKTIHVGDFLTAIYLLATIAIFAVTLWAVLVNRGMVREVVAGRQAAAKSSFEGTFFRLVSLHHELVRGISQTRRMYAGFQANVPDQLFTQLGRPVLRRIATKLELRLREEATYISNTDDAINEAVEAIWHLNNFLLSHYFRNLYNLVKFTDEHAPQGDVGTYMAIIRAQLSTTELFLLFYNCLTPRGARFKLLIEKHALFEHFPDELLAAEHHKARYSPHAYGQ